MKHQKGVDVFLTEIHVRFFFFFFMTSFFLSRTILFHQHFHALSFVSDKLKAILDILFFFFRQVFLRQIATSLNLKLTGSDQGQSFYFSYATTKRKRKYIYIYIYISYIFINDKLKRNIETLNSYEILEQILEQTLFIDHFYFHRE